jgi:hypothetical protein
VGTDLLRRVRRPPEEARPRQDNRGIVVTMNNRDTESLCLCG